MLSFIFIFNSTFYVSESEKNKTMKVDATEAECFRHRHNVVRSWWLLLHYDKSRSATGGADEVQSDRRSEEEQEKIVEAGTHRDILDWKQGGRRISTPHLQSVNSLETFYHHSVRFHPCN